MTKRETWLTIAQVAGYHQDSKTFTRAIIEARVNREAMNAAWVKGAQIREAGLVSCPCRDCAKVEAIR